MLTFSDYGSVLRKKRKALSTDTWLFVFKTTILSTWSWRKSLRWIIFKSNIIACVCRKQSVYKMYGNVCFSKPPPPLPSLYQKNGWKVKKKFYFPLQTSGLKLTDLCSIKNTHMIPLKIICECKLPLSALSRVISIIFLINGDDDIDIS